MKEVRYSVDAVYDLKRYGSMAARVRKAVAEYAEGNGAHANNVTQLVGSTRKRMRLGRFRILFEETDTAIQVVRIAPRGDAYD